MSDIMAKEFDRKYVDKAKKQLIKELESLHKHVAELEKSSGGREWIDEALLKRKLVRSAAIEEMPDGVMLVDTGGKVVYVNKAFEKLLGYTSDELIGKSALELPTFRGAKDREKAREALKKVLEKGTAEHIDIGAINKSGEEIAISFAASVIKDDQGNPKTLVAVMRDITRRKWAEAILKDREENFRALIDNSMDISVITNSDLTVRYVSPSVERTLGYKPEEIIGKNALDFLSPEDAQSITRDYASFTQNPGQPVALEVRFRHKDGSWRVIDSITNNLSNDPTVMGFVINARDITERKQAEEERVEHAAALARAEELQLSRQRIVNAQESVRRDIAQQLHGSVQNRLIILLHRLTELERTAPPGALAQELRDLRQKLGDLLDNHVRPISHRLYPSILRRGLVAALQSLGDQFEVSLDIEMELDEELTRRERLEPHLILEQVRLAAYRIAEEALTNVVKHTKASKITMGLRLLPEDWLCLLMRDNAQGFDMGSIPGGRGLLMMQDYAEVVGGKCIIRSAPGEGTEVTALLPLSGPGAEHPEKASFLE
jgi:PAS domain S-box-containing protein